ncbi:MAG: beta galactosidase jelly roll domain-containing protein, partial [Asticcacaulis sp.]|nr:beta galactosidase jelly roll domain-containing protein [Asticcacaulis sp.]
MAKAIAAGLVLSVLAGASGASAEGAAAGFAPIFSDHAVLQRDKPVAVWGHAGANATVEIALSSGGKVLAGAKGRADGAGAFSLSLPQQAAGGPYSLTFHDSDGHEQTLSDILMGDVWLCSGQSNMEFPLKAATNGAGALAGAGDPQLRIFNLPRNSQPAPVTGFAAPAQWQVSSPETAGDTSAVCYFMARQLHDTLHVPQGMIHSSWGGTAAQVWISREGLSAFSEMSEALKAEDIYRTDPAAARARWAAYSDAWWRDRDPDYRQTAAWSGPAFTATDWPTIVPQGIWEDSGIAALNSFDGVVWYRQTVTLTVDQAAHATAIDLGPVDDADVTWINGTRVGSNDVWNAPRHYTIPKDVLKAGTNVIAVRVLDTGGGGGLY